MFRVQPACSVIFLVGGQSSRMGTPKSWLKFEGRPLLCHLVERMRAVFPEVLLVSAPEQSLPDTGARVIYDEHPGEGPLAGLVVGLRAISQPLAFVSSCDAPFLDPRVAYALAECAGDFDAVVPEWEGRLHPLHAVYRASVQPVAAEQLAKGRRRMTELLDRVRMRVVTGAELRGLDPQGLSFHNMNTPEEYQRALELWAPDGGLR
jgi:molybdopterin-guanine dinucleotide biosynthesis protein A